MAYPGFVDPTKPTQDITPTPEPAAVVPTANFANANAAPPPLSAAPAPAPGGYSFANSPIAQGAARLPGVAAETSPIAGALGSLGQMLPEGSPLGTALSSLPTVEQVSTNVSGAPRTAPTGAGPAVGGPVAGAFGGGGTGQMFKPEAGLATNMLQGTGQPAQAAAAVAPVADATTGVEVPPPLTGREYDPQKELAGIKAEYAAMKAGEKADQMTNFAARQAGDQQQRAFAENYKGGMNAFDAANAQRVARINARGNEVFGPRFGKVGAVSNAERDTAARAGAGHELSTRDFFKEASTAQGMVAGARKGVTDERTAAMGVKGQEMDLAGKQRLDALGAKIASGKATPEDHANLMALLGKDPRKKYSTTHIAGGAVTNADGTTTKYPDRLAVTEDATGVTHEVPLGAGGAGGAGAAPPPGAIATLKQNPGTKAEFDAKFGKGAADRILAGK